MLICGEGVDEKRFLNHLKSLYNSRNSGVSVKIHNTKGGSPKDVVIRTIRQADEYDQRIAVVDNDRGETEIVEARKEARARGVKLIEHTPCLEAMLLAVLREGRTFSGRDSRWCKNEFESKYLGKEKRKDMSEYQRVFPKELLDRRRKKVKELDDLISLMEG